MATSFYSGFNKRQSSIPWDDNGYSWSWKDDWNSSTKPWTSSNASYTASDSGSYSTSGSGGQPAWWNGQQPNTRAWSSSSTAQAGSQQGWQGAQSWYGQRSADWGTSWSSTKNGGLAAAAQESRSTTASTDAKLQSPLSQLPPKRPDAAAVQGALQELEQAKAQLKPDEKLDVNLYNRAICFCAAYGDLDQAEDLLFDDEFGLIPDVATYYAIVEACEEGQSLQRVWSILEDMRDERRNRSLDFFAAAEALPKEAGSSGCPPLRHVDVDVIAGLRRHAQAWLSGSGSDQDRGRIPQEAFQASVLLASVLRKVESLDAAIEANIHRQVIMPIVEALRVPAPPASKEARLLTRVNSLGDFTADVLKELDLGSDRDEWQATARAELRRQELLRRWACWEEPSGPGILTWLAYDLSGTDGQAAWELACNGQVIGSPHVGAVRTRAAQDDVDLAMLPPLASDAALGHAERCALVELIHQIFEKSNAGNSGGVRVEGVVMLYSVQPPCVASIYAVQQFLQLFPWIKFCISYGGEHPKVPIKDIGEPQPKTSWATWSAWPSNTQANGSNSYTGWTARTDGRDESGSWSGAGWASKGSGLQSPDNGMANGNAGARF